VLFAVAELLLILEIACNELVISSTFLAIKIAQNADKNQPLATTLVSGHTRN